ncbi:class I SAM-dependent methyltransferase [Asanoa sp. NPDC049573]|uniref:class I SAM-dependent methyltransferase n=1 Tax=Asanoa sp. NPDC049573 TaxID=3155396 RepID=UPI00342A3DB6
MTSADRSLFAASFQHAGVAAAYAHRPPYPPAVFDLLTSLVVGSPRVVLDLGAGEGALARPLASLVDRVDALEISAAMVAAGRARSGGDLPVWHVTAVESQSLDGPFGLATAGASLHWMDWPRTFAVLGRVLAPGAVLAVVEQSYHRLPWQEALVPVIARYSRNQAYDRGFSLPAELARQGHWEIIGRHDTPPTPFVQDVAAYIEQFHSTSSLAREIMPADEARAFDAAIEGLVRDHVLPDGTLSLPTIATVVWGRPVRPGPE